MTLLFVPGTKQDNVESTDCELSETLMGLTVKNWELHKEEVDKKEEEERIRKEKEHQEWLDKIAAEEAELERKEQERQEAERAEMQRWAEEQATQKAAEEEKQQEQQAETTYNTGGDGVLTKSKGVNYYNGYKETYYSQRVLPGGGLNIPGRHVASDGTIRDGDGYIVVASSDLAYGTVVETSLGTGKIYDSGCASGVLDIYTDW